jgi:hypothetical protein
MKKEKIQWIEPPFEPVSDKHWKEINNLKFYNSILVEDPAFLTDGQLSWILWNKRTELSIFAFGCVLEAQKRRIRINCKNSDPSIWKSNEISDNGSEVESRFVKLANLLQYALPKKVRIRVYFPALDEIIEDYIATRVESQPKRLIISGFFYFRVLLVFAECLARSYESVLKFLRFR